LLDTDEAFEKLVSYPGIGAKTASCVLLFCMQRPSFAVDTHVFRLCKWLGWVPEHATRDTTFSHCEVRIPDELKYPLHYLLIKHGKTCQRCRAITGESSAGWEEGCVIEDLVERTGVRKGGTTPKKKKTSKGKTTKKRKLESEDEGSDSDELSDLELDDDEE
jgi:endonuclease III